MMKFLKRISCGKFLKRFESRSVKRIELPLVAVTNKAKRKHDYIKSRIRNDIYIKLQFSIFDNVRHQVHRQVIVATIYNLIEVNTTEQSIVLVLNGGARRS